MLVRLRLKHSFSIKAYNTAKNYYKILNLSESASQTDIKKAYRELAKKYHPDTNKGKQELFKQINEAYQVLSSQTVKQQYDQERKTSNPNNNYQQSHRSNSTYSSYSKPNSQKNQSYTHQYYDYQNHQGPQYQNQSTRHPNYRNMNYQQRVLYETLKQHQNAQYLKRFYQQQQQVRRSYYQTNFQQKQEEDYFRRYDQLRRKRQAEQQRIYEQQYKQYLKQMERRERQRKEMMDKMPQAITMGLKSMVNLGKDLWTLWKSKSNPKK